MTRVKKGVNALKNRRSILKRAKGYKWGRSKKEKQANEALAHAGSHALAHRRKKKGDFRKLWNTRLNAGLRERGTTYSKFVDSLKKSNISLNRKVLSEIAAKKPKTFDKIVEQVK